ASASSSLRTARSLDKGDRSCARAWKMAVRAARSRCSRDSVSAAGFSSSFAPARRAQPRNSSGLSIRSREVRREVGERELQKSSDSRPATNSCLGKTGRFAWLGGDVFAGLTGVTNKDQLTGYNIRDQMSPVIFR